MRNLEREIGRVLPQAARAHRRGQNGAECASAATTSRRILGPPRSSRTSRDAHEEPGVATGLAWTPIGGDILFIEATRMPGKGKLTLTGQLGDVMKESAQAALTLVKSRAAALGIDAGPSKESTSTSTCPRARCRRTARAPA